MVFPATDMDAPPIKNITVEISPQPTETSCGPTCLHAIYNYYGIEASLRDIIHQVETVHNGGTFAVMLGNHALKQGLKARIYSYNLRIFDPTWFPAKPAELATKLRASLNHKHKPKLRQAMQAYIDFCDLGGQVRMADLNGSLLRKYLRRGIPILTGLSSTFLYRDKRADPASNIDDDLAGEPEGHFVLLTGYDREQKSVHISDPYSRNPLADSQRYWVQIDRLINAILLGVLTYDANLLLIEPQS
ncbi:MAG: C39 family peptidase [Verrucomicrobia bacterium]|nr:C39 family peptidase [Verrucomicrobiota bacterium]